MLDFESLRSKRLTISFIACWMALFTSGMDISETTSKLLSGISAIHHKRRHALEEMAQDRVGFSGKLRFVERVRHELHPVVTRGLIDLEGDVAHAEARMASLHDVGGRSAEASDEEHAEAVLGTFEIVGWIHGAEDGVAWDLAIKGGDQFCEAFVADESVYIFFRHCDNGNSRWILRSISSRRWILRPWLGSMCVCGAWGIATRGCVRSTTRRHLRFPYTPSTSFSNASGAMRRATFSIS